MPDPNRPFQYHSEAELLEAQKNLYSALKYHNNRYSKMSHYDSDRRAVYDAINERQTELGAVRAEFTARREERQRRTEKGRKPPTAAPASAPAVPAQLDRVLAGWFRTQRFDWPPPEIRLSWKLHDREYVGTFRHDSGKLEVWIQVTPDTPEAVQTGLSHYLPCNDFSEQRKARISEQTRGRNKEHRES